MKTATFPTENTELLSLQRFLDYFQVLAVGVVIPFLFLYGISNRNPNPHKDYRVKEISSNLTQGTSTAATYILKGL